RRHLLVTALAAAPIVLSSRAWANQKISAADAHEQATKGEILLVDIRTHGEWRQTGLGASARPISMHKPGFIEKLAEAAGNDKSRKIALICATGGRSRWLQGQLTKYGFTNVVDVSEGMLGSAAGPGWLKTGLPVKRLTN
ncbi:MAG: rhodanese-like domain-containing protein, partial [Pseudomonadota bacterium]